ncbi:MAG: hypothetical protein BZY83_04285 [SAR202 cluster bacterium Casp-Chloro-G2]|nr:MAG: hypothetical protein BZY83_04285 [SAR202 cluster bacterium Casp-Chloro-G2]
MQYNLAQLLKEPTGSWREYEVDEPITGPEDGADRARGRVEVIRTHQGLVVRASLETQVKLTCGRCLKGFEYSSVLTLEEESFPINDPGPGEESESSAEPDDVIYLDADHVLDMDDVVRQYVLTGVPMKPLCRDGCLGLCPECGSDLNEEKCKCNTALVDPRWGALAELLTEGRE